MQNLVGRQFGRLTVLKFSKRKKTNYYWLCKCECGTIKSVSRGHLINGHTRSCGCLFLEPERRRVARKTHGKTKTAIYGAWSSMKQRCNNKKSDSYKHYGGRGIKVCKRWLNSFENFVKDMGERPKGKSLDRIDNNGNYEPKNCRWATSNEQNRNMRINHNITHKGKTQCLSDWARELGISPSILHGRIKRGWSIEKALTTKLQIQYVRSTR